MIIDVHSHVWEYPTHFDDLFRQQAARARGGDEVDLTVRFEDYQATAPSDVTTIVFGGKARRSGLWVDDQTVAKTDGTGTRSRAGIVDGIEASGGVWVRCDEALARAA